MKRTFRVGDKVMQIKNNYSKKWENENTDYGEGIYNGDIGYIYHIDKHNKTYMFFDEYKILSTSMTSYRSWTTVFVQQSTKVRGSEFL